MCMYMGLMLDRSTTHNFTSLAQENDNFVVNDTLRYQHDLPRRTCTHIHMLIECTKWGVGGAALLNTSAPPQWWVSHNATGPNA